jgi:hypothetical protein
MEEFELPPGIDNSGDFGMPPGMDSDVDFGMPPGIEESNSHEKESKDIVEPDVKPDVHPPNFSVTEVSDEKPESKPD